jgi:cell division septation protein DedD
MANPSADWRRGEKNMQMTGRHLMLAAAIAALIGSSPALADVKRGVSAWQAGDFAGAVREWRPLADKGDADAQFNMGQAYKLGRGAPADMKLAQSWYEKAAAQGHEQAQANLGLILFQSGNRTAALPWIRKAAERGDPRAQYVLGTALFNGDGVPKDWPRAYALMSSAAAQGLAPAKASLVQMEEFVPAGDKQKGRQLAQQMAQRLVEAALNVPTSRPTVLTAASPPGPATKAVPAGKPAPVAGRSTPTTPAGSTPAAKSAAAAAQAAKLADPAAGKPAVAASAGGRWRVQLGAYDSPAAARSQWPVLSRKIRVLGAMQPSYEQAGKFTRLRAGPLASRGDAEKLCAAARAASQACFIVAP